MITGDYYRLLDEHARLIAEQRAELAAKDARISELTDLLADARDCAERGDAEISKLREDAERYRWLRRRIRLTSEQMLSGAVKKCLTVRVAYSTLERKDDPADSYLSRDRFDADCAALDAAIDAARSGWECTE